MDRHFSPPNSDSSIAAAERVKAALRDYRDQWPTGNVAVVTHQDTLIDLLRSLLGDSDILSRKSNLLTAGVENCSITILEFYGESYSLKRFEMTDHLQPLSTDASPARPTAPRYG